MNPEEAAKRAPKRTQPQKEADLELVGKLLCQGKQLRAIVRAINEDPNRPYTLSLAQVHADSRKVREEWKAKATEYIGDGVAACVATLDAVAAEAWAGWEKSRETAVRKTAKQRTSGEGGGVKEQSVMSEEQTGDPAFLKIIVDTTEKKARMLGVQAPQKIEVTGADGKDLGMMPPVLNVILPEGAHNPFVSG